MIVYYCKNNPLVASYHKNDICCFRTVGFRNFGRENFKHERDENSHFSEFLLSLQTVKTMNVSFEDVELEKLIITHQSKKYKKYTRDKKFLWALDRVFNDLQGIAKCSDLKQLSYLHYEKLKKIGLSSVRVMNGRVERLLFKELENGIRISIIELDETHYGQR